MGARGKRLVWVAVAIAALGITMPASARRARAARAWPAVVVPPAQFDVAVAAIRFARGHGRRGHVTLRLALNGPSGFDYVAAAEPRRQPPGALFALVIAVNRRPAGSLAPDIGRLRLLATLSRAEPAPVLAERNHVFGQAQTPPPGLCGVRPSGALAQADLRAALSAGPPLTGYDTAGAVAQAWDAACGRPYDPGFRGAVSGGFSCPPCAICAQPPGAALCSPLPCYPQCKGGPGAIACPQQQPQPCPLAGSRHA